MKKIKLEKDHSKRIKFVINETIKYINYSPQEAIENATPLLHYIKTTFSQAKCSNRSNTYTCTSKNTDDVLITIKIWKFSDIPEVKLSIEGIVYTIKNINLSRVIMETLTVHLKNDISTWKSEDSCDFKPVRFSKVKEESKEHTEVESKCLYCGRRWAFGPMCDDCRQKYSKTRKRIGGYPTHDPHAAGSNNW